MPTYLLTWNPKQPHNWDETAFGKRGNIGNWSCGRRKDIHPKDRFFLLRQGKEPRGIIASGYVISNVKERRHWVEEKATDGKKALYVDVQFDNILNFQLGEIFPRQNLDKGIFQKMHWDSQMSGTLIPGDVAIQLEKEWQVFLGSKRILTPIAEPFAIEGIKTETIKYNRGRSRSLRDLALKESKGICAVCDVDYSKILSGKGIRVLQAHHIKQLAADAPRLTRLSDLVIVCANCHLLIHMNPKEALSIKTLKKMFSKDFQN